MKLPGKGDKRTGGSNRRKKFHKKIVPWARKHLKSGHPWDGSKVYMPHDSESVPDFMKEKKPLICDACGKRPGKLKGEYIDGKLISRCEDCISKGIFKKLGGEK
jgi:hypothetical protein